MRKHPTCYLTALLLVMSCSSSEQPTARRGEPDGPVPQAPATQPKVPPTADNGKTAEASDGKLRLEAVTFTIPEGWEQKQPGSSFIQAEISLPAGDETEKAGRLTVSVAGGSIDANIQRWRDQFGGKPEKASKDRIEANGLEAVLVDFSGEFKDQRGPFAPATMRSGYRMLAAIVSVDGQLHFVKAVGPESTIAAHADRFQKFVKSVHRN